MPSAEIAMIAPIAVPQKPPRTVRLAGSGIHHHSLQLTALADVHKKSAPVGGQGFNGDSASRNDSVE